jgi:hypothetical protein
MMPSMVISAPVYFMSSFLQASPISLIHNLHHRSMVAKTYTDAIGIITISLMEININLFS